MKRTTILSLLVGAALASACNESKITVGPICLDSPGCHGYTGPFDMLSIVGFPRARVDTTGPTAPQGGYYGRVAVGDSVTLHLVRHSTAVLPCAATDTVRTATWNSNNVTVLEPHATSAGGGVFRGIKPGEAYVYASLSGAGAWNVWSCAGGTAVFVGAMAVQ